MLTSELDYDLPTELIAQHPVEPRDASRLLVANGVNQSLTHRHFRDVIEYLNAGDVLIANDTSVINARIKGQKPSGGKVEVLLLRKSGATSWEALIGGRNVKEILLRDGLTATVAPAMNEDAAQEDAAHESATRLVTFSEPVEPHLNIIGETPLPPYIHEHLSDPSRYQTVYAHVAGSTAAPTAGLHFTPCLLEAIQAKDVRVGFVTLHVGLDTFKPIDEDVVEQHKIHTEWCELPQTTAVMINEVKARGKRVIAVGTTSARVLETTIDDRRPTTAEGTSIVHRPSSVIRPYSGFTSLYITPGYQFKVVDALITNFHLPRSTLLAMVGAFMGMDFLRCAYAEAIRERYRFYSFGDAMLIL